MTPAGPSVASSDAMSTAAPATAAPLRGRMGAGFAWALASGIAGSGLATFAGLIAGRALGRDLFGEYGLVVSTATFWGTFAGLGLGTTASKFIAERRLTDASGAGRVAGASLAVTALSAGLAAIALVVLAGPVSAGMGAGALAPELAIAAPLLWTIAMTATQSGVLAGLESFRTLAQASVVRGGAVFVGTTAGVLLGGVRGAIVGNVAGNLVGVAVAQLAIGEALGRSGLRLQLRGAGADVRVLGAFALPGLLAAALVNGTAWATNTILARATGGLAEVGLLAAGNHWKAALLFIPGVVQQVTLPLHAALLAGGGTDSTRVHDTSDGLVALATLPATTMLACLSVPLASLYGTSFAEADAVFAATSAGVAMQASGLSLGTLLQAQGRVWLGLGLNLSWAAAALGLTALFAAPLGAFGAALAVVIAYAWMIATAIPVLSRATAPSALRRLLLNFVIGAAGSLGALSLPAHVRAWAAIPAALGVAYLVFRFTCAPELREVLLRTARSRGSALLAKGS